MLLFTRVARVSIRAPLICSRRTSPFARHRLAVHATMATLVVHNSLKPGQPIPFVPIEQGKISWYACGPTVYDHSHLGHARNYVSTDIIRRILKDYFGYDVKFVMNFTDIDDKIILRARRQRLFDLETNKPLTTDDRRSLVVAAFKAYAEGQLPLLESGESDLDEKNYIQRRDAAYGQVLKGGTLTGEGRPGDAEAKLRMHISNMDAAAAALTGNGDEVLVGAKEILLPYLDSLYKETLDTSDQSMFTVLTKLMEGEFTKDMDALNVLRPDVVTRVTDYVPQIATFVEKIVDKGFAYEAEGSVYFDITSFEKAGNTYARLRPESRNDKALQEEGEGSLSKGLGGKRSPGDFALWKKSKSGEPYWPSKWGDGRPGWHIECSVMASDVLGARMDLHSGGIDLAFPHHDNELAQSEAYYCEAGHGEHTWVNYFLHMGHLSISGSKMSKSLKNFQTIKDALATDYTPRNMRVVFLMGRWNDGVEISKSMRDQADGWESTVNNFFTNTKSLISEAGGSLAGATKSLTLGDSGGLSPALAKAKEDVSSALLSSFDTPQAMRVIAELIRVCNVHTAARNSDVDLAGLEAAARWVTRMVGIFGLDEHARPPYDGLGWASAASTSSGAADADALVAPFEKARLQLVADVGALGPAVASPELDELLAADPAAEAAAGGATDAEQLVLPYVRAVSRIRDALRRAAAAGTMPKEAKPAVLALCDRVRDADLLELGVQLDDRADGLPSLVKFVPAEQLRAARDAKAAEKADKDAKAARAKEEARIAREKQEAEKWAKAKLHPDDMFRGNDKFAEWDDATGLPTKLKDGSEVNKSQLKKMAKERDKQKRLYDEWKLKFGGDGAAGPSGSG